MMFQTAALVPSTVRENVFIGPKLHNRKMSKGEVDGLLEQVGLPLELWEQDVEALSVGERQRVALAQVLANRPEVLLLDEPMSALDPLSVLKVEESVKNIHQHSRTAVILVTHNLDQARRLGGRTLLLVGGEVAACGNLEEIMNGSDSSALKSYFNHKGES